MKTKRSSRVLFVALTALILVGCAPAAPSPITVDDPPLASSEAPTAMPTPAPSAESLLLTSAGLGYLEVGQPVAAVADPLVVWDPIHCEGINPSVVGEPFAGAWVPAISSSPFHLDDMSDGLENGRITMIVVDGPGIATDEGIEVGSTEGELTAAYASFESVNSPYGYSTLYVIAGPSGRLVYEVFGGGVIFMSAVALDTEPAPFSNNDTGAPCV